MMKGFRKRSIVKFIVIVGALNFQLVERIASEETVAQSRWQGKPYDRVFATIPKVSRVSIEQEKLQNKLILTNKNTILGKRDTGWKFPQSDPPYYYFFSEHGNLYMFKVRDLTRRGKRQLASDLLSSRLAVLFNIRDKIIYEYATKINDKEVIGSMQFYFQNARPFRNEDYDHLGQEGLNRVLEEYVFDLLIMNYDVGLYNVIVVDNDPNKFLVIDRDEALIVRINDCRNYKGFPHEEDMALYYQLWSLYCSDLIEFDIAAGRRFAEYIENCPDEYIVEIAMPIFRKYDIPESALCALIARKNNLVAIYEERVKNDTAEFLKDN